MGLNIGQWGAPDNLVIHPTLNPTANDYGFPLSTKWINQSSDSIWFLVDNTPGAAVWVEAGGGSLNLFDVTDPDSTLFPATMTIATATVTVAGHNFENEQEVQFAGAGLPPEIVAGVSYYVANGTLNTFEITAVRGVAPSIVFSAAGVGTVHTVNGATDIPIVDQYDGVNITLTGVGTDQHLQDPTDIIVHHVFTVANALASTDPIDIYSGLVTVTTLVPGQAQKFIWDGAEWVLGTGIDAEDVDYVPSYGMGSTNVQAAVQEVFTKRNWFAGYNNTLGAIAVGTVVKLADGYDAGGSSFPYITPVTALADIPCGIAAENIAAGAIGQVAFYGMLNVAVNTAAGALGDNVYFDIAGAPTLTAGSSPIGIVNFVNAAGRVFYDFTELTTSGEEGILTVADLATAELLTLAAAATPWIYVTTLDTIYHYNATSAVTRDAKYILNTADAGNTRWEATCGQYVYHSHIGTFGFDTLEKETADRTIYLATTGSDTTGDGTVGSPFFSIHRALLDIKQGAVFPGTDMTPAQITIQMAGGTYDYSLLGDLEFGRFFARQMTPRVTIVGVDGTAANSFTVLESGTVDVGGRTEHCSSHLNTGKAWVANAYVGKFMLATSYYSGSAPSSDGMKMSPIYANTADTLKTAFWGTVSNIDIKDYNIVEPKVTVNFGNGRIILPANISLSLSSLAVNCKKIISDYASMATPGVSVGGISFTMQMSVVSADDLYYFARTSALSSFISILVGASTFYLGGAAIQNSVITTAKSSSSAGQFQFYSPVFMHSVLRQTGASKYYACSAGSAGMNIVVTGPIRLVGFTGLVETGHSSTSNRQMCAINFCRYDELNRPSAWYADNAKSVVYLYNRNKLSITGDKNTPSPIFVNEPSVGRVTLDNTTDAPLYYDELHEINALAIAPVTKSCKTFNVFTNTDVDTGTETVDYFPEAVEAKGVRWDITVSKSGAFKRTFSLNAAWDSAAHTVADSGEYGIVNIGVTADVTFTVTSANTSVGTVSNSAGGVDITGVGTKFLTTFRPNDTITIGADTVLVVYVTSDTSMHVTPIPTANAGAAYTFPYRVVLSAVAASDNWEVRAQRYLI